MSGLAKGAALAIFLVLPLFMVSEAEASSFNHTVSPLNYFAAMRVESLGALDGALRSAHGSEWVR